MVHSNIQPKHVIYKEKYDIEEQDIGYESSIYDGIVIYDTEVDIALGNPRYEFSKYNIVYLPIFLIINDEPVSRIGIYEIDNNKFIEKMDRNNDLELDEENILIYIKKDYFDRIIKKKKGLELKMADISNEIPKEPPQTILEEKETEEDEEEDEPQEGIDLQIQKYQRPEDVPQSIRKADESTKTGIFIENPNTKQPAVLTEETLKEAEEIKNAFIESVKNNWVQKYMTNENYDIIDNEGGGNCFFAVIRDAFEQIGKDTTVEKLRAILSKEVSDELFEQYRVLYINFMAELQEKEKEVKEIKKLIKVLKKRNESTTNKSENEKITEEAKQLLVRHNKLMEDIKDTKGLLNEFIYMKDIDSIEKFREFIQTRNYWADTWAISTIEKLLNIKVIILSEESYNSGDMRSIIQCGQLNDSDLEKQGQFKPDYYIMTGYYGNHYKLITYKKKNIFYFKELPYSMKIGIVEKCLERNSGPYYLIQDVRKFKTSLRLNANEGEPVDSDDDDEKEYTNMDLYDKNIVFAFHTTSDPKPKPGNGIGEKIPTSNILDFNELRKIQNWRRKLDDSYECNIHIDGMTWKTVEHYFLVPIQKRISRFL